MENFCNLGVDKFSSVSLAGGTANGWDFTRYSGNPYISLCSAVTGRAALGANGGVTLTGTLPKELSVKHASVALPQVLYQAPHLPELVEAAPGLQAAGPLQLSVHSGAAKLSRASAGRPSGRRRGPRTRLVSSLWHVIVRGGLTPAGSSDRLDGSAARRISTWELYELRRGRSRMLPFTFHILRSAAGRVCVAALASADSAHASGPRLCARVVAPPAGGRG